MNFLAHLHLAEPTPHSRLGNLLGDFVKGYPWDDRFPETVWQGIMEHRYVDAFTDRHEAWMKSRDLLPPELRRFAGIVVDIYYDYFLHRHWDRFSPSEEIDDFVLRVEREIRSVRSFAPTDAREAIDRMIAQQWLHEYASLDGIDRTLRRIRYRAPFLEPIYATSDELRKRLPDLEEHFLEFYPDLVAYVSESREGWKEEAVSR